MSTTLQGRFVDESKFKEKRVFFFQSIFNRLLDKKLKHKVYQTDCGTPEEAKRLQRGFHSSAVARRLKLDGYTIETRSTGSVVQVKLIKNGK